MTLFFEMLPLIIIAYLNGSPNIAKTKDNSSYPKCYDCLNHTILLSGRWNKYKIDANEKCLNSYGI